MCCNTGSAQAPPPVFSLDFTGPTHEPQFLAGEWLVITDRVVPPQEVDRRVSRAVSLPHNWGSDELMPRVTGCATYFLRLVAHTDDGLLAIKVPDLQSAFRLYANGRLLFANGIPSCDADEAQHEFRPGVVVLAATDTITLVLQVSNHTLPRGGVNDLLLVGPQQLVRAIHQRSTLTSWALFGVGFITFCVLIGTWLLERRLLSSLTYAMVTVVITFRIIGTNGYALHEALPWLPPDAMLRIDFATLHLLLGAFASTFYYILDRHRLTRHQRWVWVYVGVAVLASATVPPQYFTLLAFPTFFLNTVLLIYNMVLSGVLVVRQPQRYLSSFLGLVVLRPCCLTRRLRDSGSSRTGTGCGRG